MAKLIYKELANFTNRANGTYYHPWYPGVANLAGVQLNLTGTIVVTIEATAVKPELVGDATLAGNTNFKDITLATVGAATIPSATGPYMIGDNGSKFCCWTCVRFKVVLSGGGTDDYGLLVKEIVI